MTATSQATGEAVASERHCESSCNIIIESCDRCVVKEFGYESVCGIEASADTYRCTYGKVPENCPLIKNDIVLKLKKGVEVMESPESVGTDGN